MTTTELPSQEESILGLDEREEEVETTTAEALSPEEDNQVPSTYECDKCGLVLSIKSTYDLHMEQIHVDEAYYACEFCPATAIHWAEYYIHQCTNMDNKPLSCPHCHKTVSTKKQLSVHEEIHALQRRFTTKKLDNYFIRKLEEAEDPSVDWGRLPFTCGVCGKLFAKLYEVEYHEKLHNEERPPPNKCDKCGLSYLNKNDLNKHVARGCSHEISRKMIHKPTII